MERKNTSKVDDDWIMTFGKHKGEKLGNVPADYLIFIYENNYVFGPLLYWINKNIDTLKNGSKKS
jgi:uncharacterized protein (DUF3820 family)